ncbi:MAG: relaxase [Nitrosomonas sp.]|uniref:relaxase/mobilization nuclease domain-containing protein n=1 Tax=Nitrosomonas sp. TaxID=42353 RepID=UPI00256A2217|nr:relaxase [Nitrosomonas sp.]MCC6923453.1 relaxase [Nitrosomonas sp.]MDL1866414.1 relaxase [Betaproteobacteria bacterium PRO4]
MIIIASQRGGAARLAAHLLNDRNNDHVELYEVSGFMSETLNDALQEIRAQAMGTRCDQYLFSVSLNPPETEKVGTDVFEQAISRIEERMHLQNQPRVIVFHEKEGRRHAHCVWSRIDTQEMKAVNLPFYKSKLMDISKEICLEQGWKLPAGLIEREQKNPLNFTRAQWEQAKRLDDDPRLIKAVLKECWSVSDSRKAFENALEQYGYTLAKGDRRGFVAVDWRGAVFSLSKWLDVKTKVLKERLGDSEQFPGIAETTARTDKQLVERLKNFTADIKQSSRTRMKPLLEQKMRMNTRHKTERNNLHETQKQHWQQESEGRQARLNKGIRGLWDRLTGQHKQVKDQNEREAWQALVRDRQQRDNLIQRQLEERNALQRDIRNIQQARNTEIEHLKRMMFSALSPEMQIRIQVQFEQRQSRQNTQSPDRNNDYDLSM